MDENNRTKVDESSPSRREVESKEADPSALVSVSDILPPNLFLIPISQATLFPGMIVPVILPEGKLTKTIEHVLEKDGYIGVVLYKNTDEAVVGTGPTTSITGIPVEGSIPEKKERKKDEKEFYPFGIAAKVIKKINLPDNQTSILLNGLQRIEVKEVLKRDPYYVAKVDYLYEEFQRTTESEAMMRSALSQFKQLSKDNPLITEEIKIALVNIDGPGKLADFIASVLVRDVEDYQKMLEANHVQDRLHHLLLLLKKELDVQSVQKKIQEEINQKINSSQREYYLQEQLKLIQKELGRSPDERAKLIDKYRKRIEKKVLPDEVKVRLEEEFEKLSNLHEHSSEFSVSVNYLDWLTSLPWGIRNTENHDLRKAKRHLDEDHFGLKEVKERILEFLAVKKLKQSNEGTILCLVGPPGTGKTSLGRSVARVLNRKFFRFSVGGMRDEAEIKGHRRTYVGAMPGKIIQGLKRIETQNPVFLIDEIDKIGSSFHTGGDPASALLELLDPEQNKNFLDHYLDVPVDCSEIFFICTANTLDTIPAPLLDRLEVIELNGYTDNEKKQIARNYIIPKLIEKHALNKNSVDFTDRGLNIITSHYAREAGVRNLEKQLSKLMRKLAYQVAMGRGRSVRIDDERSVHKYLGMAPYTKEELLSIPVPGVVTGLAWTKFGGDILFIESKTVPGKSGLMLTGSLGEVMKESAGIAYTYIKGQSEKLGLAKDFFETNSVHLHVPAGATPKDGPSAGVTMALSLYSLLQGKKISKKTGLTGELTLSGRVLPVGGIKEKLLAAKRSNLKTIFLPKLNERDLSEIDPEIKKGLNIVKVETMDEILKKAFKE